MRKGEVCPYADRANLILFWAGIVWLVFMLSQSFNELNQEQPWPEQSGIQVNKFDSLLAKIKADIRWENIEIRVRVGPYFQTFGTVGMLVDTYHPKYFILLDTEFYNELTPEEQEAEVAHEAGHILFKPFLEMGRHKVIEVQTMADDFSARYVHPKYVTSALDKAYLEYLVRKKYLEGLVSSQPH